MAEAVQINFAVGALAEVQRALSTLERAFLRLDQVATKSTQKSGKERTTTTEREVRARIGAEEKAARATERTAVGVSRQLAKEERERTRVAEKESRERTRIAEREAREKLKVEKARLRELATEEKSRDRFRNGAGGFLGRSVSGALGTVGRLGAAAMGIGGGFAVADAIGRDVKLRGKARELSIQSEGKISAETAYGKATMGGVTYGKDASEVMEGLDRFVAKSGNVDMGVQVMGELLQLSNATGASFNELSEVAGQMFASDKTMKVEDLADAMRDLAAQGRAASVDMRELAQYGARLSGGAQEFGLNGAKNRMGIVRQLGGLAQLAAAKGGASSAAEATESVLSLGLDVNEHADKFAGLGIKTTGKDGMLLDPASIIRQSVGKTHGNKDELMQLFGRRSYRAVAGYANTYLDAKKELGAKGLKGQALEDASLKRADAILAEYANVTLTRDQVSKENAQRMAEADKQLESAMQDLRNTVGRELVPELIKMIPSLKELVPLFGSAMRELGRFVKFFAENPMAGIGALVAALVTKDIIGAAIGASVKQAVMTAMGAGTLGGGTASNGGSVARGLATAGLAAGAAWTIGNAASLAVSSGDAGDAALSSTASGAGTLDVLARRAKEGKLTAEQAARGKAIAARLSSEIDTAESRDIGGVAGRFLLGAGATATGGAFGLGEAAQKRAADAAVLSNAEESKAAVKRFSEALDAAALKLQQTASVDPSRGAPMSDPRRGGASK